MKTSSCEKSLATKVACNPKMRRTRGSLKAKVVEYQEVVVFHTLSSIFGDARALSSFKFSRLRADIWLDLIDF